MNIQQQLTDLTPLMREYEKKGIVTITPMGQVRAWCQVGHHQFFNPQVIKYSVEKYGKPICFNDQKRITEEPEGLQPEPQINGAAIEEEWRDEDAS